MKTINYLLAVLFGLFITQTTVGQSDTIKIEGKGQKRIVILEEGEETKIVLKDDSTKITIEMEHESIRSKDSGESISYSFPEGKVKIKNRKNYSINFLSDFSFGYVNAVNNKVANLVAGQNNMPDLNDGFNFSMNIIKQEVNLIKHQLYLTTAFGINNYYYGLKNKSLTPLELPTTAVGAPGHTYVQDSTSNYATNRLDSRFFTVPITLKWSPKNKKNHGKLAVAAGMELNFNNRVFAKQKIDEKTKKLKSKTQLKQSLDGLVPSYIVRVQYGSIGAFARYVPGGVLPGAKNAGDVYSFGLASQF